MSMLPKKKDFHAWGGVFQKGVCRNRAEAMIRGTPLTVLAISQKNFRISGEKMDTRSAIERVEEAMSEPHDKMIWVEEAGVVPKELFDSCEGVIDSKRCTLKVSEFSMVGGFLRNDN